MVTRDEIQNVDPRDWRLYLEAVPSETDRDHVSQRIATVQAAILQRAIQLELNQANDADCRILEDAARVFGKVKRAWRFRA